MFTIVRRFENICNQHADLPAVKTGSRALSYAELNALANQLSRKILEIASDDGAVGLLLEHGISICIGALACLKANKIYVPLDLNNPVRRQSQIIRDAAITTLLTDGSIDLQLSGLNLIDITAGASNFPATNLGLGPRQDDHAFLLYTSGSTGQPKGVINNNSAVVARIADFNRFSVKPGDRLTALGSGGMNMFRSLLTGATLVSLNLGKVEISALADWIQQERITIYHSVPTVFRHLVSTLSRRHEFSDLRIVNITGETLLSSDVDAFHEYFPRHCSLINGLGTTEAGTFSELRINHDSKIPVGVVGVGRSVEDTEVVLLDRSNNSKTQSDIGEIVVYSDHLSPGYWNRPEETKERFVEINGKRGYRTGDLGKWESKTNLIHLGRIDQQLKIRGHRVELGEIEVNLSNHSAVREAAVVGRQEKDGSGNRIYAYVVQEPDVLTSEQELQEFLRNCLPEYLVPRRILFLAAFPLTPNGKVNRRALPEPEFNRLEQSVFSRSTYFEKREHEILSIWREFLHNPNISVNDNFFELGGDSVVALRIMNKIFTELGAEMPISAIFSNPSVMTLTSAILEDENTLISEPQT